MRSKPYKKYTRYDTKTGETYNNKTVAESKLNVKKLQNLSYRAREKQPFSDAKIWDEFVKPAIKRARKKNLDDINYVRLNNGMIMRRVNYTIAKTEERINGDGLVHLNR